MRRIEFRRDRQFLPAALEVLETPSSPTRRALLLTLCAFVVLATAWSFVGRIDIEAVAKGKIQPSGRVKVIEPFEPGRVSAILVDDGAVVKKGDRLIALDPIEVRADENVATQDLAADLADTARYRAAIDAVDLDHSRVSTDPTVTWAPPVPRELRLREQQALVADLVNLSSALQNLDMQIAERRATISRLDHSLKADGKLASTLQQHVDMRETLQSHGTGTKADFLAALQDFQRAQATLVADQGQRGEAQAAIGTLVSEKAKALGQFRSDSANKFADASNKVVVDGETVDKAHARLQRSTLVSPVDGIVQKMAVTSIGQVVTTGQELMIIVPSGGALNITAFIDNIDIGFVKAGQDVAIKLDAFPFTRYGTLKGKVVSVATDAIDEDEARRMQANATSLVNSSSMASANSQSQKFVFPITIALDRSSFQIGGAVVPLSPGMSVTADINTDSQRIVDYLISPLTQTTSEALHER